MKKHLIAMIGLLSVVLVSTGTGSVFNRESPVWYATAPMKVKGFSDALFPEQGVNLDAKDDRGQPLWTEHRDWPDGKGVGISCVDSSSAYLYRVIHTRYLQLTFKRVDASVAETTLTAEWDVDLAGPWSSVPINETTAGTYSYAKGVTVKVAEKLSAIQTIDIISERAKGASRSAFLHAMSLVPRGEILEGDEPRPKQRRTRRPS